MRWLLRRYQNGLPVLRSGCLTATKTCDKVLADFAGAKSHWGNQMKSWLFVWNAQALPPQVVSLLRP